MKREYDFSKGKRGAIAPLPAGKLRITIRLDKDVVEWFKARVDAAGRGNYQTMMNDALRQFMTAGQLPLEASLRRVVREEMAAYGLSARASKSASSTRLRRTK